MKYLDLTERNLSLTKPLRGRNPPFLAPGELRTKRRGGETVRSSPLAVFAYNACMNKPRLRYFEQEDVLHLIISDDPEPRSIELSPDITVELNEKNEIIAVEILEASAFLRDTVLESVQAKTMQLVGAEAF